MLDCKSCLDRYKNEARSRTMHRLLNKIEIDANSI